MPEVRVTEDTARVLRGGVTVRVLEMDNTMNGEVGAETSAEREKGVAAKTAAPHGTNSLDTAIASSSGTGTGLDRWKTKGGVNPPLGS